MSRLVEVAVFLGLAAAVHAGLFALLRVGTSGLERDAVGTFEPMSVAAAVPGLPMRVAEWRRAPQALVSLNKPAAQPAITAPSPLAIMAAPAVPQPEATLLRIPAAVDQPPRAAWAPVARPAVIQVVTQDITAPAPDAAVMPPAVVEAPAIDAAPPGLSGAEGRFDLPISVTR
ncbi:MAG: hypothetical protein AAGJ74_01165 [Pseudomonadota bacterium]